MRRCPDAEEVTVRSCSLPAGLGDRQLTMLLKSLPALERLSVGVTSGTSAEWAEALPATLLELELGTVWWN